jgi:DNA-binding NarL/FixJ family response regulator
VILDYQSPQPPPTSAPINHKKLTDLQQEILIRLSKGQNQKEVAAQMQKPQNTIGNHVSLLKKKFKVETTGQLLIQTKNLGYLD